MKRAFLFLLGITGAMLCHAATYEGSGPDPACEGTLLKITEKDGKVYFIEYAIFQSVKIVIEEFRPNQKGAWDAVIRIYGKYDGHGESRDPKLQATYRFASTDHKAGSKVTAKLGWENLDWAKESERLIQYFRQEKKDFTLSKE